MGDLLSKDLERLWISVSRVFPQAIRFQPGYYLNFSVTIAMATLRMVTIQKRTAILLS